MKLMAQRRRIEICLSINHHHRNSKSEREGECTDFAYCARWDGERTLEGRRQEQIQASSGRASSYWNGHSSASASSGSSPSNPSSVSAAHSAAPLILTAFVGGGCGGGSL